MPANINPIFGLVPQSKWGLLSSANTARDGTGTVLTVCTAGANGSIVKTIRAIPIGTNTASVARVFRNNGSTNATAASNSLEYEMSLPATTITEIAQQSPVVIAINQTIPAGYQFNVTIGTAVAAGWQFTCSYEDF